MSLISLLNNITEIVISISNMFTSVLSIFMEPPLNIYVGLTIFGFLIIFVESLLRHKRYKESDKALSDYIKLRDEKIKSEWVQTKFNNSKKY